MIMGKEKEKRGFFERPLFLKIFAVFLAIILWFFVAGNNPDRPVTEVRRTFNDIPLIVRNLGTDLLVAETVQSVTLSLQGVQAAFDGLTPANLEAYVDLSGRKEGWHEIRINATAPPGVSVVRIEPPRANIQLDDLISRQMGVEENIQGEPAGGLVMIESNFEPGYVFVQGPRRKVDRTEKVTFLLDLEGENEDIIARPVTLYPVDSDNNIIEGITVVPETVAVWVEFELPRREVPVEAVFLPEGATVDSLILEPRMIELQGPKDLLDQIESVLTEPIDLDALEDPEDPEIPEEQFILAPLIISEELEASRYSVRVRFFLIPTE